MKLGANHPMGRSSSPISWARHLPFDHASVYEGSPTANTGHVAARQICRGRLARPKTLAAFTIITEKNGPDPLNRESRPKSCLCANDRYQASQSRAMRPANKDERDAARDCLSGQLPGSVLNATFGR